MLGFGDLLRSLGATPVFHNRRGARSQRPTPPGVLILVAFFIAYTVTPNRKAFEAFGKAIPALLVLLPTLAFAQLIITSELTGRGRDSGVCGLPVFQVPVTYICSSPR